MDNLENKPIPIREILDNKEHPYHEEVSDIMEKLKSGEITMCGCVGKMGDDPYCPCGMRSRGLTPTNPWTDDKIQEFKRALSKYETK
jgi:hypothetical protein